MEHMKNMPRRSGMRMPEGRGGNSRISLFVKIAVWTTVGIGLAGGACATKPV
jgi:hypothetical protein